MKCKGVESRIFGDASCLPSPLEEERQILCNMFHLEPQVDLDLYWKQVNRIAPKGSRLWASVGFVLEGQH